MERPALRRARTHVSLTELHTETERRSRSSESMNREALIAPSLLSADFANLERDMARAEAAGADWHHVDVMDGHFVPNLTIGPPVVASLARVAKIPLDVHLMIEDPWRYADAFLDAGAAGISFHAELVRADGGRRDGGEGDVTSLIDTIRSRGARVCMVVNPETELDPVLPWLDRLDMVLVMSVRPGFGGQSFMPEVLPKLRSLREEHGFGGDIQMDGGISRDNVAECAAAGCNVFVAGSALFGAPDLETEIRVFRDRIAAAVC